MIKNPEKFLEEAVDRARKDALNRTGYALKSFARAQWSVIVDQHPELAVYRQWWFVNMGCTA